MSDIVGYSPSYIFRIEKYRRFLKWIQG
ncbi:hypothetical protein [Oceanobacillus indicireducens]